MGNIEYVRSRLDEPELLAQLAEEAAELAQAALKLRRALDGSNPTPTIPRECRNDLEEELADVLVACNALGLGLFSGDQLDIACAKSSRWAERLKKCEGSQPKKRNPQEKLDHWAKTGDWL